MKIHCISGINKKKKNFHSSGYGIAIKFHLNEMNQSKTRNKKTMELFPRFVFYLIVNREYMVGGVKGNSN